MSEKYRLKVKLLGIPTIQVSEVDKVLRKKLRILVYFLACQKTYVSRELLCSYFWPDVTPEKARESLTNALKGVDKALQSDAFLHRDTKKVFLECHSDVRDFYQAVDDDNDAEIVDLWSSDSTPVSDDHLLKDVKVSSIQLEDWLEVERLGMFELFCAALSRQARTFASSGQERKAISTYSRLIDENFLFDGEVPYQMLMHLFNKTGRFLDTKSTYNRYKKLFNEPPSKVMEDLYLEAEGKHLKQLEDSERQRIAIRERLSNFSEVFVGRDHDIEVLQQLFEDGERLVSVCGIGGIGKTHLLTQFALQIVGNTHYSVRLLELVNVNDTKTFWKSLAHSLDLTVNTDVYEHIIEHLNENPYLLILDNCEQLTDMAADIDRLLTRCPRLSIMLTSREALRIQKEIYYNLESLSYRSNSTPVTLENLAKREDCTAIHFFIKLAENYGVSFQDTDLKKIIGLCELTEGLPLALKLAAGLLPIFNLESIIDGIKNNLSILNTRDQSEVNHHKSIEACFGFSFDMLSKEEQTQLVSLSIFQNGFSYDACILVTTNQHDSLATFIDKSLLTFDRQNNRYRFHNLLHQFLEAKFTVVKEQNVLVAKHAQYYLEALLQVEDQDAEIRNRALKDLRADISNLSFAWLSTIDTKDYIALRDSAHALEMLFDITNNQHIAVDLFNKGVEEVVKFKLDSSILGNIKASQAWLLFRMSQYSKAYDLAKEALKLSKEANYARGIITSLNTLASIKDSAGSYEEALGFFEEVKLKHEVGSYGYATTLLNVAITFKNLNRLDEAVKQILETIDIFQEPENSQMLANSKFIYGQILYDLGELNQASKVLQDANTIAIKFSMQSLLVRCSIFLSLIKMQQEVIDDARNLCNKALEQAINLERPSLIIRSKWALGQIEAIAGHRQLSYEHLYSALHSAVKIHDFQLISILIVTTVKTLHLNKDYEIANSILCNLVGDNPVIQLVKSRLEDLEAYLSVSCKDIDELTEIISIDSFLIWLGEYLNIKN